MANNNNSYKEDDFDMKNWKNDFGESNNDICKDNEYQFGRYLKPAKVLTMSEVDQSMWNNTLKLKRWHFVSVSDDKYFLGIGLVQLNYIATCFMYIVDREDPTFEKYEYVTLRAFGLGLSFAPSSISGSTCFSKSMFGDAKIDRDIQVAYDERENQWNLFVNEIPCQNARGEVKLVSANAVFSLDNQDALTILYPLDFQKNRPAYVHKAAGLPVKGEITVNGVKHEIQNGLGSSDWTKSIAKRETIWKWACFTATPTVKFENIETGSVEERNVPIGLNLSADVYDVFGASAENGLWVDGKLYAVPKVTFEIPEVPHKEAWKIQGEGIDLSVLPLGLRKDHTNVLGIVVSNFIQPYGYCNGSITVVSIDGKTRVTVPFDNAFGVVENHIAVW